MAKIGTSRAARPFCSKLTTVFRNWREGISNELDTDSPKKCENAGEGVLECGKVRVFVQKLHNSEAKFIILFLLYFCIETNPFESRQF